MTVVTIPSEMANRTSLRVIPSTLDRIEQELNLDPRLQSAHTRRGYLSDLRAFEAWRGGRPMTKRLVEQYAVHLHKLDRSPNSINRALAAVRWWARRLAELAYDEPLPKAQRDDIVLQATRVASIRDVRGDRGLRGRHLASAELKALLGACRRDATPAGARDAALFALAWNTGLRRAEITHLHLSHIKDARDHCVVQVAGKGNKVRQVYLYSAVVWLRAWLRYRGSSPGPVFCRIRKGGKLVLGRKLSEDGLARILDRRCLEAALAEPVTWHDFRRTFAGNLLDQGVDLVTVQRLLGHSSPTTTSNYDRRGEAARRRAAQGIQMPLLPE
jgi:site-specific recombinase XerD